ISDSDLLLHVVDISNPQVLSQIESVNKILVDLELNDIKQIMVLNKADLAEPDAVAAVSRRIGLDNDIQCVETSAIQNKTLVPLVAAIGSAIGTMAAEEPAYAARHQ